MKILYVEDELSKNIPRIARLFSKYLSKKAVKDLKALEEDEYGAGPEEVKKIVEKTNLIEVEYRFPDALRKIVQRNEEYTLFIVDRNLAENDYELDEVSQVETSFNEDKYNEYFDREGDYLLQKLIYEHVDVLARFYFLSAYSTDEIRIPEPVKTHIDFGKFRKENFIEKANSEDIKRLKGVIEDCELLNLQIKNKPYLNILQKKAGEQTAESFVKILGEKYDKKRIGDNLKEIRNIFEIIIEKCAKKIPGMEENCTDAHGKMIKGKKTIDWLSNNGHINSIIRNFLFSINKICSDFGAHPEKEFSQYKPTIDTVNSLLYALKDVISWFGKI
jgi:hypothetical protein